ncbi:MAG: hypothetical protein CMP59_08940 [Flavobacteriales bacterium]|nr:hypothetical protein [Flavobacteriales bacterium]|tara:strand:+ start:1298 stop:1711 length:414 start_codon:yes stop_codon:yes gene_type:complete
MSKFSLELEEDFDFYMLGICSHVKDYRLCWELNQNLEIKLTKNSDLEIVSQGETKLYSFNCDEDDNKANDYYLISNKSPQGYLVPEEKKCDYFLVIKGPLSEDEEKAILATINESKNVLTSYPIEASELKSKNNLIF